jgi:hypothetical protein
MRYAVVLFHFAGILLAADLPYWTDPVDATYFSSLSGRSKASLVPGTLDSCSSTTRHSVTRWECKLKGASLNISLNGQALSYPFDTLSASEYEFNPKLPHSFTYLFSGPHKEMLLDGSALDTKTSFVFERYMGRPNMARANFDIGALHVGGPLLMTFK